MDKEKLTMNDLLRYASKTGLWIQRLVHRKIDLGQTPHNSTGVKYRTAGLLLAYPYATSDRGI